MSDFQARVHDTLGIAGDRLARITPSYLRSRTADWATLTNVLPAFNLKPAQKEKVVVDPMQPLTLQPHLGSDGSGFDPHWQAASINLTSQRVGIDTF